MRKLVILAGLTGLAACSGGAPVSSDPAIEQARAEAHICEQTYPAAIGTYFERASCVGEALTKLPGGNSMRSQVILSASLLAAAKEDRGLITEAQGDTEIQTQVAKVDALNTSNEVDRTSAALLMLGGGLQNYGTARGAPLPRMQTTTCVPVGVTVQCYTN